MFRTFELGDTINFSALNIEDIDEILQQSKWNICFNENIKVIPIHHFLNTLKKLKRKWNVNVSKIYYDLHDLQTFIISLVKK